VRSASRFGRGVSDAIDGGRFSGGIWLLRTDSTRENGRAKEDGGEEEGYVIDMQYPGL
jgi:hypothetical protein